jgi:hypothetical protein
MLRLGVGLSRRKIAICSNDAGFRSLKANLVDSGIFGDKNIIPILSDNIDKAKDHTLFLVDWESFGTDIERVFAARSTQQTRS